MEERPVVSVIVTTRNEENNIAGCLESIKNQTYPQDRIEIIVVDNSSIDKTKGIAYKYTDKVYNSGPERSAQRNFGVKQAAGKYILYLDADMALSENVISECVQKCEKEGYVAIYIPERIIGKGFWIKARDFERSFYNSTCIDCVRFIRKDNFLEIDGFDETLTGPEDWDFDRRINKSGKVGIINSVLYHNEHNFCLREYLRTKIYYIVSFNKYIRKWGKDDAIIKKQLGFYYRYWGVFIEDGRWIKLILHPLLTIRIFLLRFLVGVAYLLSRMKKNSTVLSGRGVLILSPFFSPNMGGVETHLDDLCGYLTSHNYRVHVITYQPLTTRVKCPKFYKNNGLEVKRIYWFRGNLFHKLEPYPVLEVLYLTPRLLLSTFWFLVFNKDKIDVIHAHGFNAVLVTRLVNLIFRKRSVMSTHAIYQLDKKPLMAKFIKWMLGGIDVIMPLAEKSKKELVTIGVPEKKIRIYTQWVNQEIFRPLLKNECRKKLNLKGEFFVLFVGRLIEKKGVLVLLDVARKLPEINFIFVGSGPVLGRLLDAKTYLNNIFVAGEKNQEEISIFYGASDVVVVPSQYEEGFARVVLEALFSGRPVIAVNKGCLVEMLNKDVGILVDPSIENLAKAIKSLYHDSAYLTNITSNTRLYALNRFSENNAKAIMGSYEKN
ncbi:MAG: glycosyltransferase [Candidatus Omnitrophota bacterium]